jgi:uncharacterized glyoxalase superfamily protein PhnB
MNKQTVKSTQTIYPATRYVDARAAIEWLGKAFDARPRVVYDAPDGTVAHAELEIAGNLIMFGTSRDDGYPVRSPKEIGGATGSFYVVLADREAVDALHRCAVAAGAKITHEPYDTDYGSHDFSALDLEGHPWTFGTYDPSG